MMKNLQVMTGKDERKQRFVQSRVAGNPKTGGRLAEDRRSREPRLTQHQFIRCLFSHLHSAVDKTVPFGSTVSRCTSNPHSLATCFNISSVC